MINRAGRTASAKAGSGGLSFLEADFKKKDGFKISSRISKELGFIRQDYCGCVYSQRDRAVTIRNKTTAGYADNKVSEKDKIQYSKRDGYGTI